MVRELKEWEPNDARRQRLDALAAQVLAHEAMESEGWEPEQDEG